RRDAVLVDHPERPEAHVLGVVVVREREGVVGVEPAVVGVPALVRPSERAHVVVLRLVLLHPSSRTTGSGVAAAGAISSRDALPMRQASRRCDRPWRADGLASGTGRAARRPGGPA